VFVALAAVAWSTTGVLQRNLSVDSATQVAGRALFAALSVFLYLAVAERGRVFRTCASIGRAGLGLALCLTVASATLIMALEHTTVARVLLFDAIAPVIATLLARALLGEPISRRTATAMAAAAAGVAVMVGAPGGETGVGDALAFVMSAAFAVAMVIARHRRDVSMAPATFVSQALLVVLFLPFASIGSLVAAGELPVVALLGAQLAVGLVLFTAGARLISAADVGVISLLQVVLAPLWVFLWLGEGADLPTLAGGAVVIAAIVVQTREEPARERPGLEAAPPH
jgi:drug/metabolite transporter (DMT)-like permease